MGVSLTVVSADESIVESDLGESSTVTTCFRTNLSQPLNRDASFQLILSNPTTATLGLDFLLANNFIIIPGDFIGEFTQCVDFEIIGDNFFEGNETVVYEIEAQSVIDTVLFPGNATSITINILDNDGMLLHCLCTIAK